jgi:hypothetical protein
VIILLQRQAAVQRRAEVTILLLHRVAAVAVLQVVVEVVENKHFYS